MTFWQTVIRYLYTSSYLTTLATNEDNDFIDDDVLVSTLPVCQMGNGFLSNTTVLHENVMDVNFNETPGFSWLSKEILLETMFQGKFPAFFFMPIVPVCANFQMIIQYRLKVFIH